MSCERIAKKLFCTVLLCSGLHEAIPDEGVASIQYFFFLCFNLFQKNPFLEAELFPPS